MDGEEIRQKRTTVTVDAKFVDTLEEIKDTNYLGLGKTAYVDLLLYASALGWSKRLNPPIEKKKDGGLARVESFTPYFNTIIHAMHFCEIGYGNPDGLRDQNAGLDIMEQYANGGLHLIQGDLEENKTSEEIANELIVEMNARYEELFG